MTDEGIGYLYIHNQLATRMDHPNSGFAVRHSPRDGVFSQKYPALAHIPYIVHGDCTYHRLANRFLIERGLAVWHPKTRLEHRAWRIPSPRSLTNYAEWLVDFLEWAECRGIDLYSCSYDAHLIGRYQPDMATGRWSRDGKPLANSSINYRVTQACDYLVWLHDRELRPPFDVPYRLIEVLVKDSRRVHGRKKVVKQRLGQLRKKTKALQMPRDAALRKWLADVYERFGYTVGLICETILLTAMREEEVLSLPEDAISKDRAKWLIINPEKPPHHHLIKVEIDQGTKGEWHGYTKHGTKLGPVRTINIPLALAEKWNEYRRDQRNAAFVQWMKAIPPGRTRRAHAQLAGCLFLKESTGAKITADSLYYCWKAVPAPVPGWSVHDGRNWWACAKLWKRLKSQLSTLDIQSENDLAILSSAGTTTIELEIQPQLGHIDRASTDRYLKWLIDMVATPVSITEYALG